MKRVKMTIVTIVIFLLSASGYYLYEAYNPEIRFSVGGGGHDDYHIEHISISFGESVPMAKSIRERKNKVSRWNNEVVTDLRSGKYTTPFDIKVYGRIEGEQMIFGYEGIVTTLDGVTQEYKSEKVFNFVIDAEMDIPEVPKQTRGRDFCLLNECH